MPAELVHATASYAPGQSAAVACEGFWLLADARTDDPALAELWEAVRAGSIEHISGLASELAASGKFGRGFVALRLMDDFLVVVMGGVARAEVVHGEDTDNFACPPTVVQTEYRLPDRPDAICLALDANVVPARVPLARGVAPAVCLQLRWTGGSPEFGQSPSPPLQDVNTEDEPHDQPMATDSVSNETVAPLMSADTISSAVEPAVDSAGAGEDDLPPEVSGELDLGNDTGYDFLFGHTMHRSVTDAAVHPAAESLVEDHEPRGDVPEGPTTRPVSAIQGNLAAAGTVSGLPDPEEPAPPATPEPRLKAKSSGMIDSVPWTVSYLGEEVPAPVVAGPDPNPSDADAEADDDVVELTISRAKQQEILRQLSSETGNVASGPSVHAIRCPSGHPNPAHAGECRICKQPIEDQSPVTVPRPVLGVLRFSTGDVITLDRSVLIGRKPSTTRNVGNDRPHVVKLPSPEQDISRNHLEIKLDDWHVLVTDLNSTNGTMVTQPGREPERLRPDQATMIEPGTVVELAEVVSFTFDTSE